MFWQVVNTFWHLTSEPQNRAPLANTPRFLAALTETSRLGLEENISKGLLHVICNLSMDENVRLMLPEQKGLLTFLIRSCMDSSVALQVCC